MFKALMIVSAIYQGPDGTWSQFMIPNFKVMDSDKCDQDKDGYQKLYEAAELREVHTDGKVFKVVLVECVTVGAAEAMNFMATYAQR